MEQYIANSFDANYAAAWSENQGGFSSQLAQNLLQYIKNNNLNYKSCLDICCGTGEFLTYFSKAGFVCSGTEIAKSMVEYSKARLPQINFELSNKINHLPTKGKFDVITCNHDVINMQERFEEWEELFKNVYNELNNGGMFMFDFYTKFKLENWNEVSYEESEDIDHVRSIKKGMDNKCIINETYYLKNINNLYNKAFDIVVEAYFENEDILKALKKAGFKTIECVNFSLDKIEDISTRNRIHIIAKK